MQRNNSHSHCSLLLLLELFSTIYLFSVTRSHAQSVNLGVSTLYDRNIFDTYAPTSDQLTQFQANASKDWDFDQAWIGLSYYGAFFLYQNTAPKNYHAHSVSFGMIYHIENHDNDEKEIPDSSDSNSDADSLQTDTAILRQPPIVTDASATNTDSLDHYLYGTATCSSQFNKIDFQEYSRATFMGTISFRQPLGLMATVRPFYSFNYNSYPNLVSLTNYQNSAGLIWGASPSPATWIGVQGTYALKSYTTSNSFSYTFNDTTPGSPSYGHGNPTDHGRGNSGSGNSGSAKIRTVTYRFTTPSVSQFSFGIVWYQKILASTNYSIHLMHFDNPSSEARTIPERLQSTVEKRGGSLEDFSIQDIFDDRFAYKGNELTIHMEQSLPFQISLAVDGQVKGKFFTSPATSLSGDTLNAHRVDTRFDLLLNLSKSFVFSGGETLSLQTEFHYIRNSSNEPFYDFDKSVILAGITFEF